MDLTDELAALRSELALARRVADGVPAMLAYWDSEQRCRFANAAYETWFGVAPELLVGKTMQELLGSLYPLNLPYIQGALRGEPQAFEREIPDPKGGPARHSQATYTPHVVDGRVLGIVVLVADVTLHKRLEDRLQAGLRERDVLLQEVHHRVKNNLQVVASLLGLQARQSRDDALKEQLAVCRSRIETMALIHDQLYQTHDYNRVPFVAYVRSLVSRVFETMGSDRLGIRLDLHIEDIEIPVDKAIPCGLILNELMMNARKHAFPEGRSGSVRTELKRVDMHHVQLTVSDDGVGLPNGFDPRRTESLGMQMVSTLVDQLGGVLEFASHGGASFRVAFPCPAHGL